MKQGPEQASLAENNSTMSAGKLVWLERLRAIISQQLVTKAEVTTTVNTAVAQLAAKTPVDSMIDAAKTELRDAIDAAVVPLARETGLQDLNGTTDIHKCLICGEQIQRMARVACETGF
jgi:hypothetical protein